MVSITESHAVEGRILVVSTSNVCRSPFIERVLARECAGSGIAISSAGTHALVGASMDAETARRLADEDADPHGFTARQVSRENVVEADLIISATRDQLADVVPLHPRALRYAFALHDLGDLLAAVTPAAIEATPGHNRVAKVAAAAISKRGFISPRLPHESGILDPFNGTSKAFDLMVRDIVASLPTVIAALHA